MALDDIIGERSEEARSRDKWIGVWIGLLAVILAIAALGGGNATKEATARNIEASNTWAFFQAKNMRRHALYLQIDQLEMMLETQPDMPEEARATIRAKIGEYRKQTERLTSEPDKQEGLDELFQRGKALEAARDLAKSKDPYFDYGEALLQIAIILASVAIISGGTPLLVLSLLCGAGGALMALNGFYLLVDIPFMN